MPSVKFSVQFSHSVMSYSSRPHESQHTRPPCPPPTPGVHTDSCASSQWCHPAISSSVVPFSICSQSHPASESFPMSQLFAWGGQSIGVSALASVLPMNIQDWFPLGRTGLISLQSKGLSKVFSNAIAHQSHFCFRPLHLFIHQPPFTPRSLLPADFFLVFRVSTPLSSPQRSLSWLPKPHNTSWLFITSSYFISISHISWLKIILCVQ